MDQHTIFEDDDKNLMNLKEASIWASKHLKRKVTVSNISYLIQYRKIKKYSNNGNLFINIEELKNYYNSFSREKEWKQILGKDINWHLSFEFKKEGKL